MENTKKTPSPASAIALALLIAGTVAWGLSCARVKDGKTGDPGSSAGASGSAGQVGENGAGHAISGGTPGGGAGTGGSGATADGGTGGAGTGGAAGPSGGAVPENALGTPAASGASADGFAMPDGAAGARAGVDTVSVAQVLASPELVGRTVVVGGRCLGYGTIKAAGTSPMTRSDWQLEDQDAAIWVTGPMPEGTSPTQGSAAWVHIRARVAADTIRSLGGDGEKARRYLVHLPG